MTNVLRNPNNKRRASCAHARTGYYLSKEAQEDPQEEAEASICPIGSYCPGGELTSPISCPNNTTTVLVNPNYRIVIKLKNLTTKT